MPDAADYFKNISATDGLPDNSINDILEDSNGFLWLATWNGLGRYDGVETKIFRNASGKPGTLSNNMVRSLLEIPGGLLIGSDGSFDFLSFGDMMFHRTTLRRSDTETDTIDNRVSRIIRSGKDVYALSITGDILRLTKSPEKGKSPEFSILARPAARRYADIRPFTKGRLIAMSNEGISVLDRNGRQLAHTPLNSPFDPNMNIYFDSLSNRVYAGWGIGHPSRVFDIADSNGRLSENPTAFIPDNLMETTSLHGLLCFATDGQGLFIERQDGSIANYIPANSHLSSDALYSIYADHGDNLWIGTYRHGLALFSPRLNYFQFADTHNGRLSYDIVTSIAPIPGSREFVLGLDGGGIDIFNPLTSTRRNYSTANSNIPGNNVVGLTPSSDGIWMTIYTKGLACFNPATGSFTSLPLPHQNEPDNKVWTLADDGTGNIWVGGDNLNIYNKSTGKFKKIPDLNEANVLSIVSSGRFIWVGTRHKGIFKIERNTHKTIAHIDKGAGLPSHEVDYLFLDSKGNLWVTIPGTGFYRISSHDLGDRRQFGPEEGLSESRVHTIVEDPQGYLWMGTENGLFRYNPSTETFTKMKDPRIPPIFTTNSGLSMGQSIALGTTEGLVWFNPSSELSSPETPCKARFTEIRFFGDSADALPLYGADLDDRLKLDHDHNFFSIHYACPELVYSGQIRYSSRLLGLEENWSEPTSDMKADYTNVPPGDYTFQLRYTLPDGSWSEPVELKITIRHPWWSSWWAIILWILLALGAACAGFLIARSYLINRQKAKIATIEKEAAAKINNARLDLYAKICHELRTQIFLISAQLEELVGKEDKLPSSHKKRIAGIHTSALRLNKLINNLIDDRKIDNGFMRLHARDANITQFIEALLPEYRDMCRHKEITLTFSHPDDPVFVPFDAEKMEMIVTNLITNAYKYTRQGGKIGITLSEGTDKVSITVSDTGIGIVEDMRNRIFEQFFRTERGRKESNGDGIGLHFVKELVELHHGTITLESEVGKGSTFKITIPKTQGETQEPVTTRPLLTEHPLLDNLQASPEAGKAVPTEVGDPTSLHYILIIDDEPDVIDLLGRSLSDEYHVIRAHNGQEGLDLIRENAPDLVITDMMMPGLDGHQLIRAVRADKRLDNVRIAVLSALNTEEDILAAYDEGADAYLTKPLSLKLLRKNVDMLLKQTGKEIGVFPAAPAVKTDGESPDAVAENQPRKAYNREQQQFLLQCRNIIDENLQNPDFSIGYMASKLAMSHSSLYKKVKSLTGLSVVELINEYRIHRAIMLFREGNTNVQQVAEQCGFHDAKAFREIFKKKTGLPPKQFLSSL